MKLIVLAGGGGTRLYPLSTEKKPKQFLKLLNDKSLLINTIERFESLCNPRDIVIVTNQKYHDLTCEELKNAKLENINILAEPTRKNTMAAIMLAVTFCVEKLGLQENEAVLVVPSDHAIEPLVEFVACVKKACAAVEKSDCIYAFGVKPTRPDTNYGYIQIGAPTEGCFEVEKFTEKPNRQVAEQYVSSGDFYWNAGLYAFTEKTLSQQLAKHCPDLYKFYHLNFVQLMQAFSQLPAISFDYAVSEKSKQMRVVPFSVQWCDIGGWESFYAYRKKDENGNVIMGDVTSVHCKNSLFIAGNCHLSVENLDNCMLVQNGTDILLKGMLK